MSVTVADVAKMIDASYVLTYIPKIPLAEGGERTIEVTSKRPGLEVQALLTDENRGGIYSIDGNEDIRFDSRAGLVEAIGATRGRLRVEIPQTATSAVVEVNGRVYLTKIGGELRLALSPEQSAGTEITFEVQP